MSLFGFSDLQVRPEQHVHFDGNGDEEDAFERYLEWIELDGRDVCLVLDSHGRALAERAVGLFLETNAGATFTCSLVWVKRDGTDDVEDLLGKKAGSISGMPVADCAAAIHTLKLNQLGRDQRDYIATVTARPQLKRLHLVFARPGFSQCSMPSRLLQKCQPIMILGQANSLPLAQEWRQMFPVDPMIRICDLEKQLQEAQERITLRENTLVNVLLGSHPAFDGLSDARARADAKKRSAKPSAVPVNKPADRENSAEVSISSFAAKSTTNWSVGKENSSNEMGKSASVEFNEAPPPLKRIASNGGALRVVKTPGASTSKSKSRVF